MDDPVRSLTAFCGALRAEGMAIGTDRVITFCTATELVGTDELYWAGRAALVARQEEIAIYDRVFHQMFTQEDARSQVVTTSSVGVPRATPGGSGAPDDEDEEDQADLSAASLEEILRHKSFARCSVEELTHVAALMARLRVSPPTRRTRRWVRARRGSLDARRTVRRSVRNGGEPIDRAHRRRTVRPRRIVLLVDVSGSMAAHSRGLLLFAHAAVRTSGDLWDVFCFGTRLTRLTGRLSAQNVDDALSAVADVAFDRDGGTRIGDSLKAYLDEFGNATRGAVVVVCSDGLDVGPVELLTGQMQRLSRLAHRVVWLNPLLEDPAYEPLAQGMAAALPHVDTFLGGHNLASLERLAAELVHTPRGLQPRTGALP